MPVMTIKPGDHDPVRKPGHYTYGRYTAEIEKKGEQC